MAKYIDNTNLGYLISKIKAAFWPKTDVTNVTLADVATTGSYDDLLDKPTIPSVDADPTSSSTNAVSSGGVYTALSAKYEKPSGGIPATDIAAGVIPTVPVTDVTVGGTSVVSNGTAAVPAIPTVDTNPTSASTNAVSSGGVYSALADKANVVTVGSSMPSGGFLPNVYYSLGTVSGSVTWSLASSSSAADEYMLEFTAASTAPTITWPSGITWFGGSAPSLTGGKTYQVSIQNNLAVCAEF